ncbi:hypothetical protein AAF712_015609 [Marasmius tenuissimus]|uniref:Uncharacterized protein n=1 Tax=Marasmius tenuissimus TaxID=585030 RepID=A0ABR2Z8Y0_9AGAR
MGSKGKKRQQSGRTDAPQEREYVPVQQSGDIEELRKLKETCSQAIEQRNAAERALAEMRQKEGQLQVTLKGEPRPGSLSRTNVEFIRQKIGLEGKEHNEHWNDIRTCIREQFRAARLDPTNGWKSFDSRRLAQFYDAVEEFEPALKVFDNHWAIEFVAKEWMLNKKGCKNRRRRRQGPSSLDTHNHGSSPESLDPLTDIEEEHAGGLDGDNAEDGRSKDGEASDEAEEVDDDGFSLNENDDDEVAGADDGENEDEVESTDKAQGDDDNITQRLRGRKRKTRGEDQGRSGSRKIPRRIR